MKRKISKELVSTYPILEKYSRKRVPKNTVGELVDFYFAF